MLKLARPAISEDAIARVADVLRSGALVQGDHVRAFEADLGALLGAAHAVVVSSGTGALHLAMIALGIGPGDEVIVPGFTFPATANVVERVGARAVLVDVGLDDLGMDVDAAARAITPRTRAIMPVHEFGQPARIDALVRLADERGLAVVEDAACALGAAFGGRKVGTFGRLGCFSFHPRKAITTGEGGLVVTDDAALASQLRALRNHGIEPDAAGAPSFRHAGLNYRMTDFQAALGLAQLPELVADLAARRALAARYTAALASLPGVRPPSLLPGREHTFQTYHVLLDEGVDRDAVIRALRDRGVETNLGAQSLACLPYYADRHGARPEDCPNATAAYRRGLALPIGRHVGEADVGRVVAALAEVLAGAGLRTRGDRR
jgi:dTDP-4-amino-4,6-dideoxygalactose transaminase